MGNAINTCCIAADETIRDTGVRERILIVDANLAERERLAREFRAAGYDVAAVRTGEQALLLLRNWLSC